jgi:hypothetical protein
MGVEMKGSECGGWHSEFGIWNQSIYLSLGQKLLILCFFRFLDDNGILSL